MRAAPVAFLCASLAFATAACTQQQTRVASTSAEASETTFEVTPAVGVATGATVVIALGIMAIVACGIACAGS